LRTACDKAEEGDLPSIRELIDCLDGKAAQVIDQGQMTVTQTARIDRNEPKALQAARKPAA
jgi:hypothetical protein